MRYFINITGLSTDEIDKRLMYRKLILPYVKKYFCDLIKNYILLYTDYDSNVTIFLVSFFTNIVLKSHIDNQKDMLSITLDNFQKKIHRLFLNGDVKITYMSETTFKISLLSSGNGEEGHPRKLRSIYRENDAVIVYENFE